MNSNNIRYLFNQSNVNFIQGKKYSTNNKKNKIPFIKSYQFYQISKNPINHIFKSNKNNQNNSQPSKH